MIPPRTFGTKWFKKSEPWLPPIIRRLFNWSIFSGFSKPCSFNCSLNSDLASRLASPPANLLKSWVNSFLKLKPFTLSAIPSRPSFSAPLTTVISFTKSRVSEAKELNKSFFYKYSNEKPYIRLKFGVSIDGKIANQKKESKWITSEASREVVQSKRAEVNAILTTSNTILADNPFMNIRDGKILKQIENQPALIVLDSKLRISDKANIFKTKNRLIIIITDIKNTGNMPIRTFKDNVVVKFVQTKNRRIMLDDIYDIANAYNLNDILVECGNTFARSLFQDNAVDEIMYFVAPKIIGHQGYNFSGINPVRKLSDKIPLKIKEIKKINKDLYINMRR